jgi:hypothetical protein
MNTTLSIIATIISSIALIGVALGLILQSRQVKANQLQVMREMHLELIKVGIDNPALASSVTADIGEENYSRAGYLNLWVKYLQTGYSLKTISKASVALHTARMFMSEYSRDWWGTHARAGYRTEAWKKSEKEFFEIVDAQFQDEIRKLKSSGSSSGELSSNSNCPEVRHARSGPGLWPGPRRQARWAGRGLRGQRRAAGASRAAGCEAPLRPEGPARTMRGVLVSPPLPSLSAIGVLGAMLTTWWWCWRTRQRIRRRTATGAAERGSRRAVGLASEGRDENCRPATARLPG